MTISPTIEQQQILNATERLLVVQACPGSGKTTLFAQKIDQLLKNWPYSRKGIAAISFTNSASNEIYNRVGTALKQPHFIGTLDSFVLRNVVLPFGHFYHLPREGARLVPAPMDERLLFSPFKFGRDAREQVPVCSLRIVDGDIDCPNIEFINPISFKRELVQKIKLEEAISLKKKNWSSNGIITHADTHYIAAALLTKHKNSNLFLEALAGRFPTILVDEFQDTMAFLSQALLSLLSQSMVRGMVVGDEDQAIYGFGGASAEIFESARALNGAQVYSMSVTQRFGTKIAAIASKISTSGSTITAARERPETETILLVHHQEFSEISASFAQRLVDKCDKPGSTAILGRNKKICHALAGGADTNDFPGSSKIPRQIHRAVVALRMNDNKLACNIISRELWFLLTEKNSLPNNAELDSRNLTQRAWRIITYRILVESERYIINETWAEWQTRTKNLFEHTLKNLGCEKKLGISFKAGKGLDIVRMPALSMSNRSSTHKVMTIHQAKGAEFENVIVVYGKPHASHNPCISSLWWQNSEEARIGFVALTRAQTTLTLCIHEVTYLALKREQANFLSQFDRIVQLSKV